MGRVGPECTLSDVEACRRRIETRTRLDGVYGRPLALLLGYKSVRSYQKAALEGTLPKIPLHPIPRQKGRYAYTADIAALVVKRAKEASTSWEQIVDEAFSAPLTQPKKRRVKISEA